MLENSLSAVEMLSRQPAVRPLRVLFISAFYPPYVVGGWEQLVQDVNVRLQARGHITHVLTSRHGLDGGLPRMEDGVERRLWLDADLVNYRAADFFLRWPARLAENLNAVRHAIAEFQPDVVFVHVMWNLTKGVAWQAEQLLPGKVVYYVANDWPYAPSAHRAYWQDSARGIPRRLLKGLLGKVALKRIEAEETLFPLRFERVLTVSQAVRASLHQHASIPPECMRVVYNGVETESFLPREHPAEDGNLKLLYAGVLAYHKGVHTAIEAMEKLAQDPGREGITLSLLGSGHPDYERSLQRMVEENGLVERVRFLPRVARAEMPALLSQFDVLIFPSVWEEPLARMVQEAMASGLVVIGTPTGGTPEILEDGETGLLFPAEDASALANRIERLADCPNLRSRLQRNARRIVVQKFDLERMIDEVETNLTEAAG